MRNLMLPQISPIAPDSLDPVTPTVETSPQVREGLSWLVTAELVRRHPGRFLAIETHPGGGQYDCLSLLQRRDPPGPSRVDVNRNGSIHVSTADARSRVNVGWADLIAGTASITDAVTEVERALALESAPQPRDVDPHDATVIAIATVNALVDPTARWSWRNGMFDSSGAGAGPHDEWFEQFASASSSRRATSALDVFDQPAYRFWFLLHNGQPTLCLETAGIAHLHDGGRIDLSVSARDPETHAQVLTDLAAPERP